MQVGEYVRFARPVYVKGRFYQAGRVVFPGALNIRPAKIKVNGLDLTVSRYRNELRYMDDPPWPNHGAPL